MTTAYIEPLNLKYLFENSLAGSPIVFFGLFIIALSILAGTFRMKGGIFLLLISLSSIMLYNWFQGGLYVLVIFIGGLLIFKAVSKIVSD